MITISRIDTPLRAFCGSARSAPEAQLARAARAMTNSFVGLSQAEFVSDVGPRETGQLMEWSEVQHHNRAWLRRVLDPNISGTSAELTKTTRAVFEVLARYGARAINLAGFGDRVNGMHLAMVLRATADELEGTEAWENALVVARSSLERAGIDPSIALYGLSQSE